MDTQISQKKNGNFELGGHIRSLRLARGLSLRLLSERSGVTIGTLSKIENDLLSPTFETMVKLANGLNLQLDALFSVVTPNHAQASLTVTENGKGRIFESPQYSYEMLCADLVSKRMIPIRARLKSREMKDFGELISHEGEEVLYVLSGSVVLHTETHAPAVLRAGDCAYFNSRMGHACVLHGQSDAEVLWVCSSNTVLDIVDHE